MSRYARGRKREKDGAMNKTEAEYDLYLDYELKHGDIAWRSSFEPVSYRLAHDTRYVPDFLVQSAAEGVLEIHDVKGAKRFETDAGEISWKPLVEDAARIKLRLLAKHFPFRVLLCYKTANGWVREEVKG